jgi:hypothetical protein
LLVAVAVAGHLQAIMEAAVVVLVVIVQVFREKAPAAAELLKAR